MLSSTTATRQHTISCGHRVVGHEGKCRYLHGHNYTIHITCQAFNGLDSVGRVIDFSVIKSICCMWLEEEWDHKLLISTMDPILPALLEAQRFHQPDTEMPPVDFGLVFVPFNPTAENIATYLVRKFNELFAVNQKPVHCISIVVEETPKCSASHTIFPNSDILRK